ncbi:MAG: ABC transporter permease [Oscillospiraceae bacterium]|jgi:putative ABC transport system permease protein|nr:ABC transporter permease [Oscillospiraceae bacterium]
MNVFSKVTLKGLLKNRTRTIVTIIGVILSVSMITAVTAFISSLQNYLIENAIASEGNWHVEFINVDSDFLDSISQNQAVNNFAVTQQYDLSGFPDESEEQISHLYIQGFDDEAFEMFFINVKEGRLPQNETELIVSQGNHFKCEIGEEMTLHFYYYNHEENTYITNETRTYTIVGAYHGPERAAKTRIEPQTTGFSGEYSIFIELKNPRNVYEFAEKNIDAFRDDVFGNKYEYKLNRELLRALGILSNENFNAVLYSLASILITLIMFGSVSLIYNSFAISVSERTRQFGMLSSVGATKKQLRKSVLFEGLCIGIVGIPLGILAGITGIAVVLKIIGDILNNIIFGSIPISLSVSIEAIAIAALIGILTIMISAYFPANRATRVTAIESIRQSADIKIKANEVRTFKLTEKLLGVPGMLSFKNFKRNKKRYRATILSLFVSVVLFISAGAFGMYLRQMSTRLLDDFPYDVLIQTHNNHHEFDDSQFLSFFNLFKNYDDVYDGAYWKTLIANTRIDENLLSDRFLNRGFSISSVDHEYPVVSVHLIDDMTYKNWLNELSLSQSDFMEQTGRYLMIAKINSFEREHGNDYMRAVSYDILNTAQPMEITLGFSDFGRADDTNEYESKAVTVHFVDSFPHQMGRNSFTGYFLFAPYSHSEYFDFQIPADAPSTVSHIMTFFSDNALKMLEDMRDALGEHLNLRNDSTHNYFLSSIAEEQEQNRRIMLVINVFVYGFVILISLITIANVFNTITTNINLRRREFAMLKSVGMTDGGLNKMIIYECMCYGVNALLFGLPVSFGVTWLIYNGVMKGIDVPFTLPWSSIGIAVSSVFLIVFVTMMYAVSKIKKENTIDALRNEVL